MAETAPMPSRQTEPVARDTGASRIHIRRTDDSLESQSLADRSVRAPFSRRRKFFRWTEHLLACAGGCFLIYHLGFELTVMTSASMAPTLRGTSYENGDRILVEKITGLWRAPKRWEVYFLYDAEGTPVTKRIVGLPGERVSVRNNHVRINGAEISAPPEVQAVKYFAMGNLGAGREVDCGDGFFVMGDDSRDSWDSRYLGPVQKNQFRGRAWCILWPFERVRFLN